MNGLCELIEMLFRVYREEDSEHALNALAVDNPLECARLYLDGAMQMWTDSEDSLEV